LKRTVADDFCKSRSIIFLLEENPMNFLAVGIGGLLGSCGRYLITRLLERFEISFPLSTLLSNVVAALLVGLIIGIERQLPSLSSIQRLFLTTGMLGGLSTFSAFSLETAGYLESGRYLTALGNVTLNVGLSVIFVFVGFTVAKLFHTA
jgi:fluoride exporter